MQTIYKYPISVTEEQYVSMPIGARVLCVQVQRDMVCLWVLCDGALEREQRWFIIHGTGHDAPDVNPDKYVGTFQLDNGWLVFHVFEK